MKKYVLSQKPDSIGDNYKYHIESSNGTDKSTAILKEATIYTEDQANEGVGTYCDGWEFVLLSSAKRRK